MEIGRVSASSGAFPAIDNMETQNGTKTNQQNHQVAQTSQAASDNNVDVSAKSSEKKEENQNSNNKSSFRDTQEKIEVENARNAEAAKVKKAVAEINQKIRPARTSCQFSYHDETNRISIKVIDDDSKKVIREIPPEKTLDIIAKTLEIEGLLLDEKR